MVAHIGWPILTFATSLIAEIGLITMKPRPIWGSSLRCHEQYAHWTYYYAICQDIPKTFFLVQLHTQTFVIKLLITLDNKYIGEHGQGLRRTNLIWKTKMRPYINVVVRIVKVKTATVKVTEGQILVTKIKTETLRDQGLKRAIDSSQYLNTGAYNEQGIILILQGKKCFPITPTEEFNCYSLKPLG